MPRMESEDLFVEERDRANAEFEIAMTQMLDVYERYLHNRARAMRREVEISEEQRHQLRDSLRDRFMEAG